MFSHVKLLFMSYFHLLWGHSISTIWAHPLLPVTVAGQPRSLSEMVGEEGVWQHLHSSFTWLLKASGLKLQERLVEGPPISTYVENCSNECEGELVETSWSFSSWSLVEYCNEHVYSKACILIYFRTEHPAGLQLSRKCYFPSLGAPPLNWQAGHFERKVWGHHICSNQESAGN